MPVIDPWDKAAECERSIQATTDPQRRATLTYLREIWVALANQMELGRDPQGLAISVADTSRQSCNPSRRMIGAVETDSQISPYKGFNFRSQAAFRHCTYLVCAALRVRSVRPH